MNTYLNNRGGIQKIVAHEERLLAMNGQERVVMHLLLQLENYCVTDDFELGKNHAWEPVSWVFNDQPQLVRDYFESQDMDFMSYLSNN